MTANPRRRPSRAQVTNIFIVALIAALAPIAVVAIIWWQTGATPEFVGAGIPQLPPPNTLETLTLQPGEFAETEGEYSGPLAFVVEGNLAVDDVRRRDLFYLHSDEFGLPVDVPEPATPLLFINGRAPREYLPYNPFHVYELGHDANSPQQRIRFEYIAEAGVTGPMQIFIVQASDE